MKFCCGCLFKSLENSRSLNQNRNMPAEARRAIVDFGNPFLGFLYGVLLIAGTVGGFFVWDGLATGGVHRTFIVAGQSTQFPILAAWR